MNKKLTKEEQAFEDMRLQVRDLELKARFWEAQWKIRHYTLEAEKIQPKYDEYLAAQRKANEEQLARFQEQLEKMKDNPQMVVSDENGQLSKQEVENGNG